MAKPYRPCVVGVFRNQRGEVLLGERADNRGQWQLPQGGVDAGEEWEAALRREMAEELGIFDLVIVKHSTQPVRYDFPPELTTKIARRFSGQEQQWFLLELPDGVEPDLAQASDDEFAAWRWAPPAEAIAAIVPFKRQAYEQGFSQLGLV